MFRIINSKVYITRGETATYNVAVIDETGVPFRIESTINNPYVQFVVGNNINDPKSEIVKYLERDDKKFTTLDVADYPYSTWSTPPLTGDEEKLHRKTYAGQTT